jgi:hypothetical protein
MGERARTHELTGRRWAAFSMKTGAWAIPRDVHGIRGSRLIVVVEDLSEIVEREMVILRGDPRSVARRRRRLLPRRS